jgi:hypothetical protein
MMSVIEKNKKSFIKLLPIDLLMIIFEYDELDSLFSSTNFFDEFKNSNCSLKLSKKYSGQYTSNVLFRNKVNLFLKNRKLFLNLINYKGNIIFNSFGVVYGLNLSCYDQIVDLNTLKNIHTLNLSGCDKIVDVSALKDVHTLDLSWCNGIIDVSSLSNVNTLDLSHCSKITDFSPVANIKNFKAIFYKVVNTNP